jgi:DNA polymerase delta subunit 2
MAMRRCLRWRHVAPTAPDSLACYPFSNADAFVLDHTPHVFFVGDQAAFESALVRCDEPAANVGSTLANRDDPRGCVRLIRVPNFAKTSVIVLLDLATLAVEPVHFEFQF